MSIPASRQFLIAALVTLAAVPVASALQQPTTISTAGTTVRVPAGWHAAVAETPNCDPERLIVVSSRPLHFAASGQLGRPSNGQVLVLLLEDRLQVDRPVGDLRRPAHFSITWNRLTRLKGGCGNPDTPAFMRWFRTHRRYLGFIVYPAGQITPGDRAKTLAVMDSLTVTG